MSSSHNIDNILLEIDHLRDKGNYQEAYKLLDDLYGLARQGETDIDVSLIEKELNADSSHEFERIKSELDALVDNAIPVEKFDTESMDALLYQMSIVSRSIPSEYGIFTRLVNDRKQRKEHQLVYEQVRREVEDQWDQARQLMHSRSDISNDILLPFYDRALKICEDAIGENPDNLLLKSLVDRARADREKFAAETEVMTSGGQAGDFLRVLKYIDALEDEHTPMTYDYGGVPLGRMDKESAREEVVNQARIYVDEKVARYLDDAKSNLEAYKLEQAQLDLNKISDLTDELVRYIPDLLKTSLVNGIREIGSDLQKAIQNREAVDKKAQEAEQQAASDALAAWHLLQEALSNYTGIETDIVVNARRYIVQMMIAVLNERTSSVEALIRNYEFQDGEAQITALLGSYSKVSALSNSEALQRLEQLLQRAKQGAQDVKHVSKQLSDIYEKVLIEPEKSSRRLNDLVIHYGELVKRDSLYDQVASRVNMTTNAATELERLETYLGIFDVSRVNDAIHTASIAIESVQDNQLRSDFMEITQLLEYHKKYLEAQQLYINQGYDSGRRALEDVADHIGGNQSHPRWGIVWKNLQDRSKQRLVKIQEDSVRSQQNTENFSEAEKAITAININKAWQSLSNIESFTNTDEQIKWFRLLGKSFELIRIDTEFDNTLLKDLLLTADKDAAFYDRWQKRLRNYQSSQSARDDEKGNRLERALHQWESIEPNVSGEERSYVLTQIRRITKNIKRGEKNTLIEELEGRVTDSNGSDTLDLDQLIAELEEAAKSYRSQMTDVKDELDQLDYLTWSVEIDLKRAQFLRSVKSQATLLNNIYNDASDLKRRISRLSRNNSYDRTIKELSIQDAERVHKWGAVANKVATALTLLDRNFTENSDFGLFSESVDAWRSVFNESEESEIIYEGFFTLVNWHEERKNALRGLLRQLIDTANTENNSGRISPENFPRYAKLTMLNPDDDYGKVMVDELNSLEEYLRERMLILFSDLPNAHNYSSHKRSRLDSQIKDFEKERDHLKNMSEIVQQLPESAFREIQGLNKKSIQSLSRSYINLIDSVLSVMSGLNQKLVDFEGFLGGFNLDIDNWLNYENLLELEWDSLLSAIQQIGDDIFQAINRSELSSEMRGLKRSDIQKLHETHPSVLFMKEEYEKKLGVLARLVNHLEETKQLAEEEQFNKALTLANSVKLDIRELRNHSLIDNFMVKDQWDGNNIKGWENFKNWLKEKQRQYKCIEEWSQPFSVDVDDLTSTNAETVIGWKYIKDPHVLESTEQHHLLDEDSQAYMIQLHQNKDFTQALFYQAKALIQQGDFDQAHSLLNSLLLNERVGGLYTIEQALDIVGQPPIATDMNCISVDFGDYVKAIEFAGSLRGKIVLEWMEVHRFRKYRDDKKEVESIIQEAENIKKKWTELYNTFGNKVKPISDLVNKAQQGGGWFSRQGKLSATERNKLYEALLEMKAHLQKMRDVCPYHPALENLQQHPVLDQAQQLV